MGGTQDKESMSQKAEWLGAQLSAGSPRWTLSKVDSNRGDLKCQ